MDINNLFIILIIIIGFVLLFFYLKTQVVNLNKPKEDDKSFLLLQQQISQISDQLNKGLSDSNKSVQQQLDSSANIVKDVTERLTKLDETNRQVINFSSQLQNLQDILNNPKQRGIFGEYSLEVLLKNAFSPSDYQMQYNMGKDEKTGKDLIVDAALFLGDQTIPIDSKFSLENFNKLVNEKNPTERERLEKLFKNDLKARIDETSKYIRPDKGTVDFAFMFIPAEGIFYDLLVSKVGNGGVNSRDLLNYAAVDKKVHIVSPTTFYASLQSTLQGMRAYQIQESTKGIIKNVALLGNHLKAFDDYYKKLGGHLATTVNAYNHGDKEFGKIDKDVLKITGDSLNSESLQIDKPTTD